MIDGDAVDQHQEDDVGSPKHIRSVVDDRRSGVTQRNAFVRRTVPDSERVTGTGQVERHRLSHSTETDEPDLHVKAHRNSLYSPELAVGSRGQARTAVRSIGPASTP